MYFNYFPKNNIEKFGTKVFSALVENFSQTFFVGGMVRDVLLNKPILDIDIATSAKPEEVIQILKSNNIKFIDTYAKYGSITAVNGIKRIEITTFRKDIESNNRYPKVVFCDSFKEDSKRRDFTINSFYLSPNLGKILDPQNGLLDLKNKQIKFIGNPKNKILQDPLRIIRAIRFALILNFYFEKNTLTEIKNNFTEINKLTKTKIQKEIFKIKNISQQKILKEIIFSKNSLDNYFK